MPNPTTNDNGDKRRIFNTLDGADGEALRSAAYDYRDMARTLEEQLTVRMARHG